MNRPESTSTQLKGDDNGGESTVQTVKAEGGSTILNTDPYMRT